MADSAALTNPGWATEFLFEVYCKLRLKAEDLKVVVGGGVFCEMGHSIDLEL